MDMFVLAVSVMTFAAVLQFANAFKWRPIVSTVLAVGVPQLFASYREYVMSGYGLSGVQALSIEGGLVVLLQLFIAFFVFYKQDQMDESLGQWFLFTTLGAIAIYILVPAVF